MDNQRVFYKAIVYSEPTVLGGIKVRIPEIHGLPHSTKSWLDDEDLPYAYPATQLKSEDWGQAMAPLLGTQVYVAYFDNSNLIYFGSAIPSTNYAQSTSVREIFLGNQIPLSKPYTVTNPPYQTTIFKSLKGSTIEISDQDINEYIRIVGPQGGYITIGNTTYVPQRRHDRLTTTLFKDSGDNIPKEIPLETYIDIDDGKGNKILIDKNGVTIKAKTFKVEAEHIDIPTE